MKNVNLIKDTDNKPGGIDLDVFLTNERVFIPDTSIPQGVDKGVYLKSICSQLKKLTGKDYVDLPVYVSEKELFEKGINSESIEGQYIQPLPALLDMNGDYVFNHDLVYDSDGNQWHVQYYFDDCIKIMLDPVDINDDKLFIISKDLSSYSKRPIVSSNNDTTLNDCEESDTSFDDDIEESDTSFDDDTDVIDTFLDKIKTILDEDDDAVGVIIGNTDSATILNDEKFKVVNKDYVTHRVEPTTREIYSELYQALNIRFNILTIFGACFTRLSMPLMLIVFTKLTPYENTVPTMEFLLSLVNFVLTFIMLLSVFTLCLKGIYLALPCTRGLLSKFLLPK